MQCKWIFLIVAFGLIMIFTVPVLGSVKVDWTATVSGNNAPSNSDLAWETGFQTTGDWSLSRDFIFFLRDRLTVNYQTKEWSGSLDRCYLRYESGSLRVNLGRQAVSWGIGWFFRPTDLVTPLTPLQKDETRPGKDLMVVRWSTSPVTAMDLIAGEQLYAARGEWRWGETNLRIIGVSQSQTETHHTLGWDARGGLAGFYTEGKFAWSADFESGKTTALLGWGKTVRTDRQLFVEYLLNNEYMYSGQNYLAVGLQIPWDELTSYSITGVANLDDGGIILDGIGEVQLTDNIDIRGMIGVLMGRNESEFVRMANGARWNVMAQLKYYF
jgi:hypothetical protein